jgi:hypothetical protein
MLGSFQPWKTGPEIFKQSLLLNGVKSDLASIGIHSPEALLARQLASQRTAFAIAGEGPIQSDLFPVLEYAAPRAFYINEDSYLLEQYDERTRQQLLAPVEKATILRSLTFQDAQTIFSKYNSDNAELNAVLHGNFLIPCIFMKNTPAANPGNTNLNQAIAALNMSDFKKAEELADVTLKQNPTDALAGYISRIIAREKQIHQMNAAR